MNKKLLSLCAAATLFACAYAPASVLVSEDWSGSIGDSGSIWRLSGITAASVAIVDEGGIKAAHATYDPTEAGGKALPYALLKTPLALGSGLSMELKTTIASDSAFGYLRFGFMDPNKGSTTPNTSNQFNINLSGTRADVQYGGGALPDQQGRNPYTTQNTPIGQWVTYRFDIVPLDIGVFELSFYSNGELLWKGTQTQDLFTNGEIVPFFAFRAPIDGYYGEITVSQIPPIPEPSHFAIGAGVVALFAAFALRRRRA